MQLNKLLETWDLTSMKICGLPMTERLHVLCAQDNKQLLAGATKTGRRPVQWVS